MLPISFSTSMPCSIVKHIGEGFHINVLVAEQLHLVEVDAEHWKTWVHHRLHTPLKTPGAQSLYHAPAKEHLLTPDANRAEPAVAKRPSFVYFARLRPFLGILIDQGGCLPVSYFPRGVCLVKWLGFGRVGP